MVVASLPHFTLFHGDTALRGTTDMRAVLAGVSRDWLGVPTLALGRQVFPGLGDVRPLEGLVRSS